MNFLGHLYFSNNEISLMQPNLFGDFVKGKDLSRYPDKIQEGIVLHRKIDHYIDHHPAVIELLHKLYTDLPKVSGIAVDLYFDHLLAKHWKEYHTVDYGVFLNQFYDSLDFLSLDYSEEFYFVLHRLQEKNWLYHYQFLDGLSKASMGLSRRISFPNKLGDCVNVFLKNEKFIEETFRIYMKDAIAYFNIEN